MFQLDILEIEGNTVNCRMLLPGDILVPFTISYNTLIGLAFLININETHNTIGSSPAYKCTESILPRKWNAMTPMLQIQVFAANTPKMIGAGLRIWLPLPKSSTRIDAWMPHEDLERLVKSGFVEMYNHPDELGNVGASARYKCKMIQ